MIEKISTILKHEFNYSPDLLSLNLNKEKCKKNLVYSLEIPPIQKKVVIKIFPTDNEPQFLQNELHIYNKIAGKEYILYRDQESNFIYGIPAFIKSGSDYVITEHINGTNLMDLFEQKIRSIPVNDPFWIETIQKLVLWVHYFVSFTNYTLLDANLRNFIINSQGLYGFDFDEIAPIEDPADNMIEILAYIYLSLLAANPGIVEGELLDYKKTLGMYFINAISELPTVISDEFLNESALNLYILQFLNEVKTQGRIILERRLQFRNLKNKTELDIAKAKKNLDYIVASIRFSVIPNE